MPPGRFMQIGFGFLPVTERICISLCVFKLKESWNVTCTLDSTLAHRNPSIPSWVKLTITHSTWASTPVEHFVYLFPPWTEYLKEGRTHRDRFAKKKSSRCPLISSQKNWLHTEARFWRNGALIIAAGPILRIGTFVIQARQYLSQK
jgi:hypothetical protein